SLTRVGAKTQNPGMAKRDPNQLTLRADGRFQKKVRGRVHYFGRDSDRDLALREWLAAKDALLAGKVPLRAPRPSRPGEFTTLRTAADIYLTAAEERVK